MEIQNLFGLPAHPLVVHAAVVLLPLAALVTVLSAAFPRLRKYYAPAALVIALSATVAVGLAQSSGESLQERVDRTQLVHDHAQQGELVLPWAIAVTVAAAAVTAAPFLSQRKPDIPAKTITATLLALSLITGAGAIWSVSVVGHSGAKATWDSKTAAEAD